MGVPKFYRWLSERYPLINQVVPTELKPEFDCLYLDMNGIVHNCTHGNDTDVKVRMTEDQMFANIFKYLDKLFTIAMPQKLLFMAIDGVAPRAKMNQQRQRRFRSAQDAKEAIEKARAAGEKIPEEPPFDSNCITPGTLFMQQLSRHIQYFIRKKMKEDAAWQKIKVIFSGAEVAGEGEHKIMQFIRNMKMQAGYNPNLRHCLYGLDADLVMLSLVSHEAHFALLREEVIFGAPTVTPGRKALKKLGQFQFLHISVLREYLDVEFKQTLPFGYSLERCIDDFVVLCFLVGNDFLPHGPTLDIGEGGLDTLFKIYKEQLPLMGGYIVEDGQIQCSRFEMICTQLGAIEEEVFQQRINDEKEFERRRNRNNRRARQAREITEEEAKLWEEAKADNDFGNELKALQQTSVGDSFEPGTGQFKMKYYREKFKEFFDGSKGNDPQSCIRELCESYFQGIVWCLQYYYQGCSAWQWFFPYRYAPLASDMRNLSAFNTTLEKGQPFRPLEQLMGVLPPASAKFLPRQWQHLMTSQTSPIKEFYPDHFEVDMNGKRNPWEGIALLEFIDEDRLLAALQDAGYDKLTDDEVLRNTPGDEYVYSHSPSSMETIPSTLPSLFPQIKACHSIKQVWRLPAIPLQKDGSPGKFVPALPPGCNVPHPGYPHLGNLPYEGNLAKVGLNVFGRPSAKDTMTLVLKNNVSDTAKVAAKFVGRRCFVSWPYLKEALVVEARDQQQCYGLRNSVRALSSVEQDQFRKDANFLKADALGKTGVDVGRIELIFKVRPFVGMKRMEDGSIKKWFSKTDTQVAAQMAVVRNKAPDARYVEKPAPTIEEAFPLKSEVCFIGPEYYGCLGEVTGYSELNGKRFAQVKLGLINKEPKFAPDIIRQTQIRFFPSYLVAKKLNMHPLVLSKILSSVKFNPGRYDLGLKLKFAKQGLTVPEYARQSQAWKSTDQKLGGAEPWEYSEKAVALIHAYRQAFPAVFELLTADPHSRDYDEKDLLRLMGQAPAEEDIGDELEPEKADNPKTDDKGILDKIADWIKTVEDDIGRIVSKMILVPVSSRTLPATTAQALEREGQQIEILKESSPYTEVEMQHVPPYHIYKRDPEVSWSPSERDKPELGDRVVSLRSDTGVPFGLRGTIVALHNDETFAEIVFDREFITGEPLHGRCSDRRGKTLALSTFLNISKPRVLAPKGQSAAGTLGVIINQRIVRPAAQSTSKIVLSASASEEGVPREVLPKKKGKQKKAGSTAATIDDSSSKPNVEDTPGRQDKQQAQSKKSTKADGPKEVETATTCQQKSQSKKQGTGKSTSAALASPATPASKEDESEISTFWKTLQAEHQVVNGDNATNGSKKADAPRAQKQEKSKSAASNIKASDVESALKKMLLQTPKKTGESAPQDNETATAALKKMLSGNGGDAPNAGTKVKGSGSNSAQQAAASSFWDTMGPQNAGLARGGSIPGEGSGMHHIVGKHNVSAFANMYATQEEREMIVAPSSASAQPHQQPVPMIPPQFARPGMGPPPMHMMYPPIHFAPGPYMPGAPPMMHPPRPHIGHFPPGRFGPASGPNQVPSENRKNQNRRVNPKRKP